MVWTEELRCLLAKKRQQLESESIAALIIRLVQL